MTYSVFHLPARPARISHKIRRGRKVLKDVRPPDTCFFPGSESRFQKNTPVPSFITGFHRTLIVYYNTGLLVPCWYPASAVALRVKWILIGRFSTNQRQGYEKSVARVENESRRFSFRSRNLSQFKADFKLFKA